MCIIVDGKFCIVGDFYFYYGCFIIDDFFDCNDDLVDVFFMDFFVIFELFSYVVNEFLCYFFVDLYVIVVRFNGYGFDIEVFGCGRFVVNFDGSEEGELVYDFFVFF